MSRQRVQDFSGRGSGSEEGPSCPPGEDQGCRLAPCWSSHEPVCASRPAWSSCPSHRPSSCGRTGGKVLSAGRGWLAEPLRAESPLLSAAALCRTPESSGDCVALRYLETPDPHPHLNGTLFPQRVHWGSLSASRWPSGPWAGPHRGWCLWGRSYSRPATGPAPRPDVARGSVDTVCLRCRVSTS